MRQFLPAALPARCWCAPNARPCSTVFFSPCLVCAFAVLDTRFNGGAVCRGRKTWIVASRRWPLGCCWAERAVCTALPLRLKGLQPMACSASACGQHRDAATKAGRSWLARHDDECSSHRRATNGAAVHARAIVAHAAAAHAVPRLPLPLRALLRDMWPSIPAFCDEHHTRA